MSSRRTPRQLLVAVLLGVLIGGGLMAVSPAGAEVSQAAAGSWKKIWKKNLKPLADRRYYTKRQSDASFSTKTDSAAAAAKAAADAAAATAAANRATDSKLGNYYTKAQSDATHAPVQPLYRGSYMLGDIAKVANSGSTASVSFGATFPSAPTPHYIRVGDPIPAGCSGTATAPNAAPGHFCVFESSRLNVGPDRVMCRGGSPACGVADPFGAGIYVRAAAPGEYEVLGTWAARPGGAVVNPSFVPAPKEALNSAESDAGSPTVQ